MGIIECLIIGFLCNKYLDSSNPLGKRFIALEIILIIIGIVLSIVEVIRNKKLEKKKN